MRLKRTNAAYYREGRIIMFIILPTISRLLGLAGLAFLVNAVINFFGGEGGGLFGGLF